MNHRNLSHYIPQSPTKSRLSQSQCPLTARQQGEPYKDLFDFCRRVDLKKINRRSLEALINAGALDRMGPNGDFTDRATLMASLGDAIQAAEQENRNQEAGMMDLFGGAAEAEDEQPVAWSPARPWNDDLRLQGEKDTLGLFLTGHPIDQYEHEVDAFVGHRLANLQPTGRGEAVTVAGLVVVRPGARKAGNAWPS